MTKRLSLSFSTFPSHTYSDSTAGQRGQAKQTFPDALFCSWICWRAVPHLLGTMFAQAISFFCSNELATVLAAWALPAETHVDYSSTIIQIKRYTAQKELLKRTSHVNDGQSLHFRLLVLWRAWNSVHIAPYSFPLFYKVNITLTVFSKTAFPCGFGTVLDSLCRVE